MNPKNCIIGLEPVENFDEFKKSLFSHFDENPEKRCELVSLVTKGGQLIRVQVKLIEIIKSRNQFRECILFIGYVFEIKNSSNSLAGTTFIGPHGGTMPMVKGTISTRPGDENNFLWSNQKLFENEIVWINGSPELEICYANGGYDFSEKYATEHNIGASMF